MEISNEDIRRRLSLVATIRTPAGQFEDAIVKFDASGVWLKSSKPGTKLRPIRFGQIRKFKGTANSRARLALACVVGVPGAWEQLQKEQG